MDEDHQDSLRGPQLPPEQQLYQWTVEDWMQHFERHDDHRSPLLAAMRGRPETEQAFAEAWRQAEEADQQHMREAKKFFDSMRDKPLPAHAEELLVGEDAEADEPWRQSLPELQEYERLAVEEGAALTSLDSVPCAAQDDARALLTAVARRLRRQQVTPLGHYVLALLSTTIVGVHMGFYWDGEGFPLARVARLEIAATRFEQVARLMTSFSDLGLADCSADAARLAANFREAAGA